MDNKTYPKDEALDNAAVAAALALKDEGFTFKELEQIANVVKEAIKNYIYTP